MLLNDARTAFLASRRSQNIAASTLAAEGRVLRFLMEANGNVMVKNLTGESVERMLAKHPDWKPATYNRVRSQLEGFFKWCRARGHMRRDRDPLEGFRHAKVTQPAALFVPQERFAELLHVAEQNSPRDRAMVALGLYTFIRAGEMARLRWQDVDLEGLSIEVLHYKTHERDPKPICEELAEELERWRFAYGALVGEIPRLTWQVVPPYQAPGFRRGEDGRLYQCTPSVLRPTSIMTVPHYPIQQALKGMGYDTLDEGGHTLRRSGAYALYQRLSHLGHDRAGRIVQSMLGHKSFQTTESYLRLSLEKKARDDILRGKPMFDTTEGQVIHLGEGRAGGVRM